MKIRLSLIAIGLLFISLPVYSQTKKEKEQQRINAQVQKEMEKQFGKIEEVPKEYRDAEAMVQMAIEALKNAEVNKADSLIYSSIQLYPTHSVFQYVKEVYRMPDLNRATATMEKLYESVKSFPSAQLIMLEPYPATYENGKMVQSLKKYDKERALFNFGGKAYTLNREFGKSKWGESMLQRITGLSITDKTTKTTYDYEYNMQHSYKITLALLVKDYDKAIKLAEQMPVSAFAPKSAQDRTLASIYMEKGDYDKAKNIAETLDEKTDISKPVLLFSIHALSGRNEDALQEYNKYRNSNYYMSSNGTFYSLALIDLNKKDYKQALVNLDSALNYRASGSMAFMADMFLVDKWKVHKALGDAYAGLQQYEKAKDNYNIALFANLDYEPAVAALANLESSIAKETAIDKLPPVITVSEPAVKRGLKVTTVGNDVMVRGIASDPSGLKAVSINGQPVYAQAGGNFWGNISLANGINKITIKATDAAGNIAEQVFEIEKTAAAESEIIAVTEKEGNNYCLLIAAQNYKDASIPSLENPIQDAVRLKLILKNQYNFPEGNIYTLFNPEADDIKRQLLELTNTIQPEDNLLIFYAGHGIWVEKEKKGYWLLTDAKRTDANSWLPNKDVLNLIAKLPSRHTLLITDACFSGGVFKTRSIGKDAPANLQLMNKKISRVAITSGNDTEVPDESVFMKYLVKALSENKEKYLTAQKMFITQIMEAVMMETKTEPRYGTLELAGHVGGDYIFTKK